MSTQEEKIDWDTSFPAITITRKDVRNAGVALRYIALLTYDDMIKIATHAAALSIELGSFNDDLKFATINLVLGTKLDQLEETMNE
jgi:hypothetical protein